MANTQKGKQEERTNRWWINYRVVGVEINFGRGKSAQTIKGFEPVPRSIKRDGDEFNVEIMERVAFPDGETTKFLVKVTGNGRDYRVIYRNWVLDRGPSFSAVLAQGKHMDGFKTEIEPAATKAKPRRKTPVKKSA